MFLASYLIVFAISIYRILHQKSSENVKVLDHLHHFWHFVSISPVIIVHFDSLSLHFD